MESNKIFAALLLAGIIAMLSGFTAKKMVTIHMPEEPSYVIEVAETTDAAGGEVAEEIDILSMIAVGDVAKGEKLSKACAACHSFEKGGPNRVGPNLWDIVNAKHAHLSDFPYSEVFVGMKDKTWTYENISDFLAKPKQYAPGTKMSYIGMKKPEDRANIIAWLRTLSDSPAALPEAKAAPAEGATDAPAAAE